MKKLLLFFFLGLNIQGFAQSMEHAVRDVMGRQQTAWNSGNILAFMDDYWRSDSLLFVSKNGVTRGWDATLQRYLKTYSSRELMGTLKFDIQEVHQLGPHAAWVLGKWHLTRPQAGDVGGYFTLIFRQIDGKWVICSDHTS